MIFSSVFFIFIFLPLTLVLYFLVPRAGKNVVLLISSLIFYAWGEPIYIVLMMFSIVYNYISGVEIDYYRNKGNRGKMRFVFWMAVAVNLAVLMFFKYYGFLMENYFLISVCFSVSAIAKNFSFLNSFPHLSVPRLSGVLIWTVPTWATAQKVGCPYDWL